MLALIFVIVIIILSIVILNASYNTFVYRQIDKWKWLKFTGSVLIVYGIIQGSFWATDYFYTLPVLKQISYFLDGTVEKFFSYVDYRMLVVWFACPLIFAWIIYLIKTGKVVFNIRKKFKKWEKDQTISKNKDQSNEETKVEKQLEANGRAEEKNVEIHFLDVPVNKIKFKSVLGLQRAYETAKKNGLIIDQTSNGYVAVYSDGRGLKDLKIIFSENSISIDKLPGKPSLVFFDKEDVKTISIQEQFLKLKAGMKND